VPVRASEIAAYVGAELRGPDLEIQGVSSLAEAIPMTLTFATKGIDTDILQSAGGGLAVIVSSHRDLPGVAQLVTSDPRLAFAQAVSQFFPQRKLVEGIASTAQIAPTAQLAKGVSVGHFCVVGADAIIGEGTELRHHVVVAASTVIGARCIIKSHVVIGEEGYGFQLDENRRPVRIPHHGTVEIGADVEIGCATVIARGTIGKTKIGSHVKIDDHCFIAHNVIVGDDTLIIAGAEISGGVQIGARSWVAPQAAIINKVKIGDDALIGIGSVVVKNVPANTVVAGNPATERRKRYH